jgi:hypothetical protein
MTTNINVKQYATTGSLQTFLLAVIFGIALTAVAVLTLSMVIVLGICIAVYFIRHLNDWIVPLLGIIVGSVLALLLGISLPEQALLVAIFGAVWF